MKREIKFRGKRLIGNWEYGDLETTSAWTTTLSVNGYFILNETVGQYTGLRDKKGKEIYELDEVILYEGNEFSGVVKMVDGSWIIESNDGKDGRYLFDEINEVEVIGNIFEEETK